MTLLNSLTFTPKQLEVLMKTEFGSMVCALKELNKMDFWKAPKVLEYIISSFVKDNTFKVAGQTLESSPDNLAVIFLMKRFKMSEADRERYGPKEDPTLRDSDFYKEYFLIESVDTMNMISWTDEIHKHLMESIASVTRNKSKPHIVTGCTVFLLISKGNPTPTTFKGLLGGTCTMDHPNLKACWRPFLKNKLVKNLSLISLTRRRSCVFLNKV
ncbi:hypothetical protein MKW98_018106, partial [Papaver atlanticum]